MKLTKASVPRFGLPAGTRDKIFFDDDMPGFGLRLRDGGKRTWIAQYRVGTKQRRVTIGTVETYRGGGGAQAREEYPLESASGDRSAAGENRGARARGSDIRKRRRQLPCALCGEAAQTGHAHRCGALSAPALGRALAFASSKGDACRRCRWPCSNRRR